MDCPACGHENRDTARFCEECASPLIRVCPSCGTELRPSARFCDECATPVPARATEAPERAPRAYTPKHLADKILTSRSALEGERKQVTVLFADVKGSMDLAEQVDPEEWHRILDRFFQILADGVHRFEGTVNQYLGDGIMALFGAPIAHEDHAQRACWSALHLRQELRAYSDELRRTKGLNFSVRMGLNSGEVIVGKIGDDLRMDYTAQGYTVGLAQRIEQLAPPESTYLTEHTARLVEGFFQLRDLGDFDLKGASAPLRVYELRDVGVLRTRLDAARARGFSRFVGRADEMATLELALHRAEGGDGQAVGVVGEAGVGKSRLCLEFVERCRAKGTPVFEAHCPAHGRTVPLLPILELLRNAFGITGQDGDQVARDKIAGRLLLLDEAFREVLPLVFDFLRVPDPERPVPQMDPEARQRQLFTFLRRLVQARSEREPAILLVDDLHWIDTRSDAYLTQFAEAVDGTRTLLLVNFRPEYHAEWVEKSNYQQLPLSPLGPESAGELLHALLGDDPSLADLPDLIHERTGGNPFFIEEVVQSLVESESLEGAPGAYRLVKPIGALDVPDTVQPVLAARIDRLPEREKRVLQTASVIGKMFSEPLLLRVAELPEPDLAAALSHLRSAEFVREEALYPEAEYAFKHPLTQEVAYDSQLSERRKQIHSSVARALEELHAHELDDHATLIARHWEEAGEALEAAQWHRRAAAWAATRDLSQYGTHWRKVRELAASLPPSREAHRLGALACSRILESCAYLGASEEEAAELFEEGRELALRGNDPHRLTDLLTWRGLLSLTRGAVSEACETVAGAVALAEREGDNRGRVNALRSLADVYKHAGHLLEVEELVARLEQGGPNALPPGTWEWALRTRGDARSYLGRYREAERDLGETIQSGTTYNVSYAHMYSVGLAELTGDVEIARPHALRGLEIAQQLGNSIFIAHAYAYLGIAHLLCAEWREAADSLERSLALARERRTGLQREAWSCAFLAEAYLGLGDREQARAVAETGIRAGRDAGTKLWEARAHLAVARILLQTEAPEPDRADEALRRAEELIAETGGRAYQPFVHEERANLARVVADDAGRDHHLREAHRLYTEMDATGHAERLARELGP
jgi:predicted ATPase/class 3 adenylate cyclase